MRPETERRRGKLEGKTDKGHSEFSGDITSMPRKTSPFGGSITMAPMATINPSPATSLQIPVEAAAVRATLRGGDADAVPTVPRSGFAGDTPATTVPCPVATPI